MKAILIDAYRHKDSIVLWLKTPENTRYPVKYRVSIYVEDSQLARQTLSELGLAYLNTTGKTYLDESKRLLEIRINRISRFERIVRTIERRSRHRLNLYNADLPPEQMFLFENNLCPLSPIEITERHISPLGEDIRPQLTTLSISAKHDTLLRELVINEQRINGEERYLLEQLIFRFNDPDIILMEDAFSVLPFLRSRMLVYSLECPFHRWDTVEIRYKGGKTFFSYGRTVYRDYAIRLNGRFLIDTSTVIGSECDIESMIELSQLSGVRLGHVASRSFGAVFQSALVRKLIERKLLVPFKEKPVDPPITMHQLLKFDRIGHTFDSMTGMHHEVAEIDFSSLYPWIIYNYNISPETMKSKQGPFHEIPNSPLKISLSKKGIVPSTIKPFIDRRMHYKKNPSTINRAKALGLKWVLVTSYGYLRFREFKLGMATTHMAIGAFAREILLKAKEICEEKGYRIVHGIVDSLYLQKIGINEKQVKELCRTIELETGIPLSFEGIFRWIVFLPSINNSERPVPTRYYGLFSNGDLKVRGLEVRQRGIPNIVKRYQNKVLSEMSMCRNRQDLIEKIPHFCKEICEMACLGAEDATASMTISKTEYSRNIPQKIVLEKKRSLPGKRIGYYYSSDGIRLPEEYRSDADMEKYRTMMVRALFALVQPFGISKKDIMVMMNGQQSINCYLQPDKEEIQVIQGTV